MKSILQFAKSRHFSDSLTPLLALLLELTVSFNNGNLWVVAAKRFKRLPSGRIQYMGESYAGFNKPKRAPKGSKKKFVVLGKQGDKIKKVSYGHRDYSDFRKHKNPKRRANFRARHNCKTAKDKTTARYWACKHLW